MLLHSKVINTFAVISLTTKGKVDDSCQQEKDYCIHGGLFTELVGI